MNYGNIFCHLAVIFICTSSSVTVKIALTDEEMDNFYTKCLNLSNGQQNFDENIDKKQLQQRLTASNFYKDLLQLIRPILMLKNDKILSKFEKFSKFVEGIDKISHLNNCKIWLLRWEIINFSVENHLIPLPWDEATHMAKMLMIRQANCAEIGTFLEQNEGNQIENPPPDVADFLTEVTATHFTVFVTDLLPNFNCAAIVDNSQPPSTNAILLPSEAFSTMPALLASSDGTDLDSDRPTNGTTLSSRLVPLPKLPPTFARAFSDLFRAFLQNSQCRPSVKSAPFRSVHFGRFSKRKHWQNVFRGAKFEYAQRKCQRRISKSF
uniref:Uncharacterized protein n=1 Tax=Globodera pallida TaxID=36090 RepID=A0A183C9N8_GLOPA